MNTINRRFSHPAYKTRLIHLIAVLLITGLYGCSCIPPKELPHTPLPPLETQTPTTKPTLEVIPSPVINPEDTFTPHGITSEKTLKVFSDPKKESSTTGEIPIGSLYIAILEDPVIVENTIWVKIKYQNIQGWVDFNNLAIHQGELPEELISFGYTILTALQSYHYDWIEETVHPDQCLRFSPYSYLAESDKIFCPGELKEAVNSDKAFTWGKYDGTGESIQMSFQDYHQRFIFDSDFTKAPIVGFNTEISSGNAINNIPDIYPNGKMIEYHYPGFDPQYGGMDWRSLRLVFISDQGKWYLAAIVHGEWTI
jgi:hypothetical protein